MANDGARWTWDANHLNTYLELGMVVQSITESTVTRRGLMVRMLRRYIEDGLSDLGNFQDCLAYPVGDDGAEIVVRMGGHEFTFYIAPGADGDPQGALGTLAVKDHGRDKVVGPIDPMTWAQMSAFVRERI